GRALGGDFTPGGDGGYGEKHPGFRARVNRDGSIHFNDRANVGLDSVGANDAGLGIAGHFDITDAVMRALGQDPYRHEKMKVRERTRGAREQMAAGDRSARLREAEKKLGAYLEKVWAQGRWTVAQRKAALFALWEEAAEDGDPELQRAGAMARATIEAFVR